MTTIRSLCVFCGSSKGGRPEYALAAEALGKELARRGIRLVYGGGDVGTELQELQPFPDLAVLGEVAAGLAHEPDRGDVGELAERGVHEPLAGRKSVRITHRAGG